MIPQLYDREDLDDTEALDRYLDGRRRGARAERRRVVDASPLSAWLVALQLAPPAGQKGPRRHPPGRGARAVPVVPVDEPNGQEPGFYEVQDEYAGVATLLKLPGTARAAPAPFN